MTLHSHFICEPANGGLPRLRRLARILLACSLLLLAASPTRALRQEYDFIIVGPVLGRHAQKEAGYIPLLFSQRNFKAVLLVADTAPYRSVTDLRGRRIISMEPLTTSSQFGGEMLRQAGLRPESDVTLKWMKNPYNAIFSGTKAGRALAKDLAQDGYRRPTERELKRLDEFLHELKRQLAQ